MVDLKLAFVHNMIAPYRHPLFERLSRILDLTVYYCSVGHTLHRWNLWPRDYDYPYKILRRIPIGEFSFNPLITKMLVSSKPDVVVLGGYEDPTMWSAFLTAKLLKVPIIHWTEGIREPDSALGLLSRPIRRYFIRESDAVVVPGRLSRRYVMSLGVKPEAIFTAPDAIDNDLFIGISSRYKSCRDKLKQRLGLGSGTVILFVGQIIARKGIEYLLEAGARLTRERSDIIIVLVGSGPLEKRLKDLASRIRLNELRVIPSGLGQEALAQFYSAADIFVLPTLEDVWGFVVNEAMACGLPVVATRVCQAAREMIRVGENGYVVKEADSDQLYSALRKLIADPALRERMGKRSREIVMNEFGVTQMVSGFLSAIEYCARK